MEAVMTLACLSKQLRFDTRAILGQHPSLFLPMAHFKRQRRKSVDWLTANPVSKDTEIVIEGFPRSANTFATVAFYMMQNREVKMAHHIHAPSQLIAAARQKIPAILLVREPADSVLSLVIRLPCLTLAQACRGYIRFYKPLLEYKESCVVAPFEQVTHHYDQVLMAVNQRYGKNFTLFTPSEENTQRCFEIIEERNREKFGGGAVSEKSVARPSSERREVKERLQHDLESSHLRPLLEESRAIYTSLVQV
jgi:hypothetical protein